MDAPRALNAQARGLCRMPLQRLLPLLILIVSYTLLILFLRRPPPRQLLPIPHNATRCSSLVTRYLHNANNDPEQFLRTDLFDDRKDSQSESHSNFSTDQLESSIFVDHSFNQSNNGVYSPANESEGSAVAGSPATQPYVPVHKLLYDAQPAVYRQKWAEMLREGRGLVTCWAGDGQEVTWENGVQYKPRPTVSVARDGLTLSQFEAHVPFDLNMFFLNDRLKIKQFEAQVRAAASLSQQSHRKVILWWKPKRTEPVPRWPQPLRLCPDLPCVITHDRSLMDRAAALVVNEQFITSPPPPRRSDQVSVFYQIEADTQQHGYAGANHDIPGWAGWFNWTMAFRLDADISTYYGLVRRRPVPVYKDYKSIVAAKTGIVACIISNLGAMSGRLEYIRKLQQHVHVDIIGSAGTQKCPRSKDGLCTERISRNYKFYLAFESAFCDEYVTEKFFKNFNSDVITITRGLPDYTKHAPKGTFISTADFKSPKELADRIKYLNAHDEDYINILKYKDKYVSLFEDYMLNYDFAEHRFEAVSFCHLCHRLWNVEKYAKTIKDVREWFKKRKCYKRDDL